MGMSTNGILAYGYVIGNGAPPVEGLDEDESWRPADFAPEPGSDEYYDFDFRDWAERKLLAAAGRPVEKGEYFDPEDTKRHWGVWFEAGGWGEDPSYMLVAYAEESFDHPADIDFAALERRRIDENWSGRLINALDILGITENLIYPEDAYKDVKRLQTSRWLLTSYYG